MTGLDIKQNVIMEIASVITDEKLNIIAVGPELAISTPDDLLDNMDEWCTRTHTASGLVQRCRDSHISVSAAEELTLEFLSQHIPPNQSPLCGNSIGTDRAFLKEYMPDLESYVHYRNLDVTVLRILRNMWGREFCPPFSKSKNHRAKDDVYESIEELNHFRKHLLDPQASIPREEEEETNAAYEEE